MAPALTAWVEGAQKCIVVENPSVVLTRHRMSALERVEYRIQRDAEGKPVMKDGEPVSAFGPEDHLPADLQETYKGKRNLWGNWVRNLWPQFQPLRHR
jgi:hypothetical protein